MTSCIVERHTVHRYSFRFACHEYVALTVYGIQKGHCSVHFAGSYGDWSFEWWHIGPDDPRQFLAGVSEDYLLGKLTAGKPRVYDGEATLENVKRAILKARKDEQIDAEEARRMYDELSDEYSDLGHSEDFSRWYENLSCDIDAVFGDSYTAHGCYEDTPVRDAVHLTTRMWPGMKKFLKAELAREKTAALEAQIG